MDRKVSVLINSYNHGRFLPDAIESVLAQDYEGEIECIVVDDGSTDDTAERVKPYLEKIVYIRQANAGQLSAVNTGYRHSSGDVIFFLDADDCWMAGKVRTVMSRYTDQPGVGLVNHSHVMIDGEGSYINAAREVVGEPVVHNDADFEAEGDISELLLEKDLPWLFNTTSTMSLPRKLCEAIFPLPEGQRHYADVHLAVPAALLAPVGFIQRPLGYYRLHGGNHSDGYKVGGSDVSEEEKRAVRVERAKVKVCSFATAATFLVKTGLAAEDLKTRWKYLKSRAQVDGRPFVCYLPAVLADIWRWEASLPLKLRRAYEVTYKCVDRTLRGKWK